MNEDWRSRNTMTGRDALKAAAVILGLLFACIMVAWVLVKILRPAQPFEPGQPPAETRR